MSLHGDSIPDLLARLLGFSSARSGRSGSSLMAGLGFAVYIVNRELINTVCIPISVAVEAAGDRSANYDRYRSGVVIGEVVA